MGEASKLTPSGADVTDPVYRLRLAGQDLAFPEARAKRLDNSRTERMSRHYLKEMVGRDGIEPPTPGFSVLPRARGDTSSGDVLPLIRGVPRLSFAGIGVRSLEVPAQFPHTQAHAGGCPERPTKPPEMAAAPLLRLARRRMASGRGAA